MKKSFAWLWPALLILQVGGAKADPACAPWLGISVEETPRQQDAPVLKLKLKTKGNYPCTGYTLPVKVETKGNRLRLFLGDAERPKGVCPYEPGPAQSELVLPSAPGEYSIEFLFREEVARYGLSLTERELRFDAKEACFVELENPKPMRRVPKMALGVSCQRNAADCPDKDPKKGPSCASFFAEPLFHNLPALPPLPGGYTMQWITFGVSGEYALNLRKFDLDSASRLLAAGQLVSFRTLFSGRYSLDKSCLSIEVRTAQGGILVNNGSEVKSFF